DRAKSFAGGEPKVASRHIVLPVDEGLLITRCLRLRQYAEVGLATALERVHIEAALCAARIRSRRCAGPPHRPPTRPRDRRRRGRRRRIARTPPMYRARRL